MNCLGGIEIPFISVTALVSDCMAKAAYVAIMISGDVAAVSAAIEAGKAAVGDLGKLIAAHVIARPHNDLIPLLPAKL
jgi:microcompartment protein CcmL/EutN